MQPSPQEVPLFQFGAFTLDTEKGELRRENERVPLQEKPLQLLSLLVAKPGQIVTREEIRQKLWGVDTFVEFDDSLNHAVKKLREALGDSADTPRFIKTLPRQGYRFLAEVQTECPRPTNGQPPVTPERPQPHEAISGRRRGLVIGFGTLFLLASGLLLALLMRRESVVPPASLLVLPFQALDAAAQEGRIGEGISEQVTAKLMNLKGLRLVSPEAAYRVSTAGVAPAAAGRRLNAEAVLIGSVRTAERKIRVNAQLIRTEDGRILWADGGLELEARDLLEAERVLATAIAARLRGALTSQERAVMASTPTSNAEAHELFVRGKLALRDRQREHSLAVAGQLFEQAVRLDPGFAEALAWLALAQAYRFTTGSAGDQVRRASIENARKAIAIDPSVATARRALITIFFTTGQAEEGLREAARLRQYSPGDAVALSAIANAYWRAGMPDRAVPLYQQALEMDPEDTDTLGELAFAAYWAGQYELGLRVLEGQPPQVAPLPRMNLAVATGRREMARSAALQLMRGPGEDRYVVYGGMCLRDFGEGELALRILRERLPVLERQGAQFRNERVHIALGLSYSFLGNKQRARDQVGLAFESNPGDPWTSLFSAEIHAQLGEDRQAIEYLRQAIAGGFLARPMLDWPHFRLYELRAHPEIRALRDQLSAKIAALRQQY